MVWHLDGNTEVVYRKNGLAVATSDVQVIYRKATSHPSQDMEAL